MTQDLPKLGLSHPDLDVGAGALLWIDDAKISTIEFYTFTGDGPKDEAAFKIDKPDMTVEAGPPRSVRPSHVQKKTR